MSKIPVDFLRECFDYNPVSGELRWRERPLYHFAGESYQRRWNKRFAGTPALKHPHTQGYLQGTLRYFGVQHTLLAHIVIFALRVGHYPEGDVDHRNLNKRDNRWKNLRSAGRDQNMFNVGLTARNTTGFKGVSASRNRFIAQIKIGQKQTYLGTFDTPEQAHEAYKTAALQHHKEFARFE